MPGKGLKTVAELSVGIVTCPGVRLNPNNGLVRVRICALGFHVHTSSVLPHFPLEFNEKFLIERTFPLCRLPSQLLSTLNEENVVIDLVQLDRKEHVILASFLGPLNDFFFPSPPLARTNKTQTRYMDVILEPSPNYPGFIGPRAEITSRVVLREIDEPSRETKLDHASNLTLGIFGTEHPNYSTWYRSPNQKTVHSPELPKSDRSRHLRVTMRSKPAIHSAKEHVKPFVVRHVDPKLIERTPGLENIEHPPLSPTKDEGFMRQRKFSVSHRSSSSLETKISLDRRLRSVQNLHSRLTRSAELENSRPEPPLWCQGNVDYQESTFRYERRRSKDVRDFSESERTNVSSPSGFDSSPRNHCPCCAKHHRSGACTVCKLYRQYFGSEYPAHLSDS